MTRYGWLGGAVLLAVSGILVLGGLPPAVGQSTTNGFKPVLSVHHLMEGQVQVLMGISNTLKNQSAPKRAETIEGFAFVLAELANVNTLNHENADYKSLASQLREQSLALAEEAGKKKDADDSKMDGVVTQIKATCQACHDKYQ